MIHRTRLRLLSFIQDEQNTEKHTKQKQHQGRIEDLVGGYLFIFTGSCCFSDHETKFNPDFKLDCTRPFITFFTNLNNLFLLSLYYSYILVSSNQAEMNNID